MRVVIIVISFLLFSACGNDSCPNDSAIIQKPVEIKVERLEQTLFSKTSTSEVETFLTENQAFSQIFLHADQYPNDSVLAGRIYGLIQNPSIDTLYTETMDVYDDISEIVDVLETAVGKLQTLYPETKTPELQTAVTGLYNDLFISDSLIIVGLDYFIGEDASYRPKDVPEYIMKRYDRDHLASIIVKFYAGNQVTKGRKSTLLSEMIDFGKTYYLASRLAPCTPDSILLGYSPEDMVLIHENEPVIWANFLENEILYETSHIVKRRFLGERPNTYEISAECPGRIGAWVGWRIVEAYMEKNDVSIKALLNQSDNEVIFRLSGYKPQSR